MSWKVMNDVMAELNRAVEKHGPLRSRHEAYAVLQEEVDEFWDMVKKRAPNPAAMREELVQVAAMAIRAVMDLGLTDAFAVDDVP